MDTINADILNLNNPVFFDRLNASTHFKQLAQHK